MKIVRRYKNERKDYTIRVNKNGDYFIYHLKKRLDIDCDCYKEAVFILWAMTH